MLDRTIRADDREELAEALLRRQLEVAEAGRAVAVAALDRERKAIGEIQRSLLPETLPEIPGFDMASYYRPSERAGGDYYDVVPLVRGQWGFVMADVSGHGTAAAVIMAVMRTLIHANLPDNRSKPSCEFLETVNRVMSSTYLRDGRFVTVWCAVLDPLSRRLTYSSAGHNAPRLVRRSGVLELNRARGFPLGISPDATYTEESITLEPDDLLVIHTDGITESMRPESEKPLMFGTEGLDQVLLDCGTVPSHECVTRVIQSLTEFTDGSAARDDQTLLVLRTYEDTADERRIPQNVVWYDAQ